MMENLGDCRNFCLKKTNKFGKGSVCFRHQRQLLLYRLVYSFLYSFQAYAHVLVIEVEKRIIKVAHLFQIRSPRARAHFVRLESDQRDGDERLSIDRLRRWRQRPDGRADPSHHSEWKHEAGQVCPLPHRQV